jgi:hypothetical protein
MPVSERKLLANRLNALKSTGPRTADGKARVRMNRLRHGLRASDPVLPEEDAASFYLAKAEIEENLEPKWPLERILCAQIAEVTWRLMRIGRMEVRIFEKAMEHESAKACDSSVDAMARQLDRPDCALVTLSTYERGLRNTLSRLLNLYQRIKTLYGNPKPCSAYESAVQSGCIVLQGCVVCFCCHG